MHGVGQQDQHQKKKKGKKNALADELVQPGQCGVHFSEIDFGMDEFDGI